MRFKMSRGWIIKTIRKLWGRPPPFLGELRKKVKCIEKGWIGLQRASTKEYSFELEKKTLFWMRHVWHTHLENTRKSLRFSWGPSRYQWNSPSDQCCQLFLSFPFLLVSYRNSIQSPETCYLHLSVNSLKFDLICMAIFRLHESNQRFASEICLLEIDRVPSRGQTCC